MDFEMSFQKEKNHNNLLTDWDNYANIILKLAFNKTKLEEFDVRRFENNKGKICRCRFLITFILSIVF